LERTEEVGCSTRAFSDSCSVAVIIEVDGAEFLRSFRGLFSRNNKPRIFLVAALN
jgi:hypothetical protein